MSSCPNKVDGFIQGQVSRLVVPFSFKMGYGDACLSFTRSSGEKVSHWKPQDFSKEKLFQHIDRLIDASGGLLRNDRQTVCFGSGRPVRLRVASYQEYTCLCAKQRHRITVIYS